MLLGGGAFNAAHADDYSSMLAYLTHSRIDGSVLNGSSGAIALNVAAGDQNQQANLRVLAAGDTAAAYIRAHQQQRDNRTEAPAVAHASIGGGALGRVSGLVSINQASGTANAQLNTASVVLAPPGIREASSNQWFADVCACTQQAASVVPGSPESRPRTRSAAVEGDALRGAQGIVQLNQIAGSHNLTANHLSIDLGVTPR
ncbi:MAG: hypothetical protein EPN38_02320 [Rhodanobacteraceae bacterium]|nr:MAG: hypothetical protein EPN38_02320 [Rhodanobacteraceae bacterium]